MNCVERGIDAVMLGQVFVQKRMVSIQDARHRSIVLESDTPGDWTNETLAKIRDLYRRNSDSGGASRVNKILDYRDKPNRQMCRLFLSMMDKMNVHTDKFGDASEPLNEV